MSTEQLPTEDVVDWAVRTHRIMATSAPHWRERVAARHAERWRYPEGTPNLVEQTLRELPVLDDIIVLHRQQRVSCCFPGAGQEQR